MPTAVFPGAAVNPFSTRGYAPGALRFIFPGGAACAGTGALYDAFSAHGFRGQIVGPRGTGKSTLLRGLANEARARGHRIKQIILREEARRLPRAWWRFDPAPDSAGDTGARRVLFLDGAEQLSRPRLWMVRARCRAGKVGLLLSAHAPLGLPLLYRTRVDPDLARVIVARVLAACGEAPPLVSPEEAVPAIRATGGNMREALFQLYDRYEARWARGNG